MKNFVSFRIIALAFIAGFITQVTCADASVSFLGVAAGDATTSDVTVWTRAKDESNPQPTQINVQITTDPTFTSGVTTLLAGTADATTDYTAKTNVAGYSEQFLPVNVGGQNCLQPFFAGQGNYTAYDNHELGNKQYINGGAPAGLGLAASLECRHLIS